MKNVHNVHAQHMTRLHWLLQIFTALCEWKLRSVVRDSAYQRLWVRAHLVDQWPPRCCTHMFRKTTCSDCAQCCPCQENLFPLFLQLETSYKNKIIGEMIVRTILIIQTFASSPSYSILGFKILAPFSFFFVLNNWRLGPWRIKCHCYIFFIRPWIFMRCGPERPLLLGP